MNDYSDIGYLIQQLISGSNDAWSYFLNHYGRLIYHCINKIMSHHSSQEDKDDCFQEIMRVLIEEDYKRLKQIRSLDNKAFRSYLGVLTKRRTLNYIRGMKVSCSLPEEMLNIIPDLSEHPDMDTLRGQIIDLIGQKLPDQERLVMFYLLEGLTLEEISELMGLKLGTVFNIKKRSISELKDLLGQDEKIFG